MGQSKPISNILFAVLLAVVGSLTIGDFRVVALQVTALPKEVADMVDTTVNPVQFFDTEAAAKAKIAALQAEQEQKTRPK